VKLTPKYLLLICSSAGPPLLHLVSGIHPPCGKSCMERTQIPSTPVFPSPAGKPIVEILCETKKGLPSFSPGQTMDDSRTLGAACTSANPVGTEARRPVEPVLY
jgi:hypothetical protein